MKHHLHQQADTRPACMHYEAVEVDLLLGHERVAWWCPDCETQFEPDWRPPPRQFLDARHLRLVRCDPALRFPLPEPPPVQAPDPNRYVPTDNCCRCGAYGVTLWWRHQTSTTAAGAYCRNCDPSR